MTDLDEMIENFLDEAIDAGWDTTDGASGQCSHAAAAFARVSGGTVWGGVESDWRRTNHAVCVLPDGRAVDWTARQFGTDAPFPAIHDSVHDVLVRAHRISHPGGEVDMAEVVGTPEEWEREARLRHPRFD